MVSEKSEQNEYSIYSKKNSRGSRVALSGWSQKGVEMDDRKHAKS